MDLNRCAIYARKSSDNEAGVQRQVDLARDFAAAKNWTVDPAHVYQDNDISGSVFDRPGLNALMAAMITKPRPFDVLVLMDASRLGRDMAETLALELKIVATGVRVFFYQDGTELLLDTPTQKLVASVTNFASEDYRFQVRAKTRDALRKKAQQGHAVGGRILGYDNVPAIDVSGKRTHSDLRINEVEAAIVRRIFTLCADGLGIRGIATRLNGEGIPAPRSRHVCTPACEHKTTYTGTWMATTITAVLNRELYRGRRRWETVDAAMPALQIVSDDLWQRAQRRRGLTRQAHHEHRQANGQLTGRDERPTPHLLSGLLRCACGSSLVATSRVNKNGSVRRYYACARSYKQGSGTCGHLIPYDGITDAILSHFAALTPGVIEDMVSAEYDQWLAEIQALTSQRGVLQDDLTRLDGELARLAEAVAQGGQLPALLAAMASKQAQRDDVAAKLEHAQGSQQEALATLTDWHSRLTSLCTASAGGLGAALRAGASGRQMLRKLLPAPIVVTPVYGEGTWQGWTYEGEAYLGRLAGSLTCHQRTERVRISYMSDMRLRLILSGHLAA